MKTVSERGRYVDISKALSLERYSTAKQPTESACRHRQQDGISITDLLPTGKVMGTGSENGRSARFSR